MRGNISDDSRNYVLELKEALKDDESFGDEIVTIDDQMMTVRQAITLLDTNDLTSRTYNAKIGSRKG